MDVRVTRTSIPGVLVVEPDCFRDHRGLFMESYNQRKLREHGIDLTFVQDNHSRSGRHVLRGFHYQDARAPQYRLIRCVTGHIFYAAVDLRVHSATFGRCATFELSSDNLKQVLIPPEFAHGYLVLSDVAEVHYKCTGHHSPEVERSLAWNDPDVAVPWPISTPILSQRDLTAPSLRDYLKDPIFVEALEEA
jgi:dTDP-4-dehydrorhamnose 3,5-epimerase